MPRGSMQKYFSENGGDNHGGNLQWPGTADGFPFRGTPPNLRNDEYSNIPLAMDYHSEVFHLYQPEDKQRFDDIMDRIVNGWYMQHKRMDRWSDEHCGLIVWLEWVQIYGESVNGKTPESINATDPKQITAND